MQTNPQAAIELTKPVTLWLKQARGGNEAAFASLFDYFYPCVSSYLKKHLTQKDLGEGFEEDLASECMAIFWRRLNTGCFSTVTNRDELWFALMRSAKSKSIDRRRFVNRKKRFDGNPRDRLCNASQLNDEISEIDFLEEWIAFAATLPDDKYRNIAFLKMAGMEAREISALVETSPRTVKRKLDSIKASWAEYEKSKNRS